MGAQFGGQFSMFNKPAYFISSITYRTLNHEDQVYQSAMKKFKFQ